MKALITGFFAAVLAVTTLADAAPSANPQAGRKQMTEEEREAIAEKVRHFTGGRVVRPRSQQGRIVFLDLQSKYASTNSQHMVDTLVGGTEYRVVYEKGAEKWDITKATEIARAHKANIAIIIVDDAVTPPMLVAPEEGWAAVNVARLEKGLPDNKLRKVVFSGRCRKEIMRAFSLVCGGGGSPYKGSAINAATIEDLDVTGDFIPFDTIQLYRPYLRNFGVTPRELVTYRQAVMEGWAADPTNEYQVAAKERALVDKAKREAKKAERAKAAEEAAKTAK